MCDQVCINWCSQLAKFLEKKSFTWNRKFPVKWFKSRFSSLTLSFIFKVNIRALVATRKVATSSPQQTRDDVAGIISKSRHGDVTAILTKNKLTSFIVVLWRMPLHRSDRFQSISSSLHRTLVWSYPSIVWLLSAWQTVPAGHYSVSVSTRSPSAVIRRMC